MTNPTQHQWVRDTGKELEFVDESEVLLTLDRFGRKLDWWSSDHHVIGGYRYAKTAEAAKKAGWHDIANFFVIVSAFRRDEHESENSSISKRRNRRLGGKNNRVRSGRR